MPNYFAIGFVGILACVGVGMEYHRQSVQAGVPFSEFGPSQFVAGVKESVRSTIKERSDNIAAVKRASKWQGEMRSHLPDAPEGWTRRGFDEGDNSAVVPEGQKATRGYGRDHHLSQFKHETFANMKNLKHVYKQERSGQSDEDFLLDMMQASTYVYEKGDETVLIELLKKDEQETESESGITLAKSLARDLGKGKFDKEPEPFAVIAGIPFFEAFDKEGLMLGHYRVLYAKIGLNEEVRFIVHANASSSSTRDILRAVDFEALNGLLRIPMKHVSNALALPDAKTEQKYSGIANYVRMVAELNLKTQLMMRDSAYRVRSKPTALVEQYGAETPLRDMYVLQYRDAMQRLALIDDLAHQSINMNDLINKADPPEEAIQEAAVQSDTTQQAAEDDGDSGQLAPVAIKPTMSEPLRRELESLERSTKVQTQSNEAPRQQAAAKIKPAKAPVKAKQKPEKKIKVSRFGNGNKRRTLGKSGCSGGSFCKVGN